MRLTRGVNFDTHAPRAIRILGDPDGTVHFNIPARQRLTFSSPNRRAALADFARLQRACSGQPFRVAINLWSGEAKGTVVVATNVLPGYPTRLQTQPWTDPSGRRHGYHVVYRGNLQVTFKRTNVPAARARLRAFLLECNGFLWLVDSVTDAVRKKIACPETLVAWGAIVRAPAKRRIASARPIPPERAWKILFSATR